MKIIAGEFRRRNLRTNPGLVTRPMTARVKEMLFSRLESDLTGAKVADVFAGTGTLGLESLSRGAASCVFIEKDRKAAELLRENVSTLGVEDRTLCWQTDAFRSSFRPQGVEELLPYDLIFFDPPYRQVSLIRPGGPLFKSLQRIHRAEISSAAARLILRTPRHEEFAIPSGWEERDRLVASGMRVHFYDKVDVADAVG